MFVFSEYIVWSVTVQEALGVVSEIQVRIANIWNIVWIS